MYAHDLRVAALKRIMGDQKVGDFAETYQLNASYISQLLNNHRKFGERAAENMAVKLGVPRHVLTNPGSEESIKILENFGHPSESIEKLTTVKGLLASMNDEPNALGDPRLRRAIISLLELHGDERKRCVQICNAVLALTKR